MNPHDRPRRVHPVWVAVGPIVLLVLAIVALLGFGRLLVAVTPVRVELVSDGAILRIDVDGTSRSLPLVRPIVLMRPIAPIANRREHQIDGSDSTNMLTFQPIDFADIVNSPYYRFQARLREEWRYSTWVNLTVVDSAGQTVIRQDRPQDEVDIDLPRQFRLTVDLERPEIGRGLELQDDNRRTLTVAINRNEKAVRVGPTRLPDPTDLTAWYFPRAVSPHLATLLDLVTRALAIALGLVLLVGALAALLPALLTWQPGMRTLRVALPVGIVALLAASWYVARALFDFSPHILDAVAYTFQARTFAAGMLTALPPLVNDAFPVPFSVLHEERWFVQYPPGTAALLALGFLAGVPWLVQPVLAAGAVVLSVAIARRQYGPGTALLVLVLLVTSPFVLLTAGSFLSHAPALFFTSIALYALTRYVERPSTRWAGLAALGLGLTLLTREIAIVPFGAVLAVVGLTSGLQQRGRALPIDGLVAAVVFGAAAALYLSYNALLTGDPFLLPRHLFNGSDVLGFGPGIGFYGEHTVASGLVNAEQQLVSLGFYLAGWPYGFSLAMMFLPFVTRRAGGWDFVHGALVGLYVVLYVAEFYHGIAFGPRYYFEAVPSMMILTARGFTALAESVAGWLSRVGQAVAQARARESSALAVSAPVRARQATALVLAALLACNALYFLPRQTTLYGGYTGLPGGGPALDDTIARDLSGRVSRLDNALVVTTEWWWYTMYFAAMNCATFNCPTVYALGADTESREVLQRMYPDRVWYDVVLRGGVLRIVPGIP